MQLRFLLVTGPNSPSASVDFGPGLNVIYSGSNTGKTHILRLIDYVLGAKNPPEPIVEQAGYDFAHVGVGRSKCKRFLQTRSAEVCGGWLVKGVDSPAGKRSADGLKNT